MKEPVYISATQLQVRRLCERKAGFIYVAGRRQPPTKEQQFGTDAHAHAARWLATGATPRDKADPTWVAFSRGIRPELLPPPGPENDVEHEFKLAVDGGEIHLVGFVDCYRPEDAIVTRDTKPGLGRRTLVLDHKFVADVRYALKPDELATDAQAVLYAAYALWDGAEEAEAWWVYYPKKGKGRPQKVSVTFTERTIAPEWERLLVDARAWAEQRRAKVDPMTMKPNALACTAYGGCPFRGDCKLTKGERLAAHLNQFDRAHGRKGLPILSGPDTIPAKETNAMTLAEKLAAMKKNGGLKAAAREMDAETRAANPPDAGRKAGARGVNPPEKDLPPAVEKPAPPAPQRTLGEAVGEALDKVDPTGEQRKAVKAAKAKPAPEASEPGRITVYVDCAPVKGGKRAIQLVELLAPVMPGVAERAGVAHWSLAEFGSGPGLLARAFDDLLAANPPEGSVAILVDGSTAEARAVKEVLFARADVVVRAVR